MAAVAAPAVAQQAPNPGAPLPLTTPTQPKAPSVPVIGAEPAPPQGYEPVAPGTVPAANMPAAPVGVGGPGAGSRLRRRSAS